MWAGSCAADDTANPTSGGAIAWVLAACVVSVAAWSPAGARAVARADVLPAVEPARPDDASPSAMVVPTALPESYALVDVWLPETPSVTALFHPMGIAIDRRGNLVVVEAGNGRLTRSSTRGTEPDSLNPRAPPQRIGRSGNGPGEFSAPEDVAVSSSGARIYVADTGNRRVQVLAPGGSVLAVWSDVGLPRGITVGPGPSGPGAGDDEDRIYLSDAAAGVVRVLAPDGTAITTWPVAGEGVPTAAGLRPEPLGLSVTPNGYLVVADHANQRIVWLDADASVGLGGAIVGSLALDNVGGPGGAPLDVGVAGNGDVFVAVSRGILHFRPTGAPVGERRPGTGVAAGLVHVDTWPVYRNELPAACLERGCSTPGGCYPLVVEERQSHEGVQRLDVRAGSGLYVTYAADLRWPDRVVVYPALPGGAISPPAYGEGWIWPVLCRDYSEAEYRHATDMERVDTAAEPYYSVGLDSAAYLRIRRADGQWYGGSRAMQAVPGLDLAIDRSNSRVAILQGNNVRVLDPQCLIRGFAPPSCVAPPIRMLNTSQLIRRDRTNECRRALPIPWRAGDEGPCIPEDRWWHTAVGFQGGVAGVVDTGMRRLVARTTGGWMVTLTSLGAAREGFRAFVDIDFDQRGQLWVLAQDGAVRLWDERGRELGDMVLVGPANGRSASLSVAPDGTFFVLTGDGRVVKYVPEVLPGPTPTATLSPTPGPSPRPTRVPPQPSHTPRPTLPARAVPVAEWRVADHAGPGRYRDLGVAVDGRVIVPDADHDRLLVFDRSDATATPSTPAPPGLGPCRFVPEKSARPDRLPLGDTTEVTLRLEGTCGSRHDALDVVVVVDTSCQMAGERFARVREGLVALVEAMTLPQDRMALLGFDENQGGGRVIVPLTDDRTVLREAGAAMTTDCRFDEQCRGLDARGLSYMRSFLYPYGCRTEARIADGLRAGREALFGPASRPEAGKALILLSSSLFDSKQVLAVLSQEPQTFDPPFSLAEQARWNLDLPTDFILPVTDREYARWEGWKLREAGVRVYTTGVGVDSYGAGHPPDEGLLAVLAWPAHNYRPAGTPEDLLEIFAAEGRELSARVLMASVVVTDRIPPNMRYVPGSASPAAEVLSDGGNADALLRWTFREVALAGLPALSFRLQPLDPGVWPTNVEALADYVDGLGYAGRSVFGIPFVAVIGPTGTPEPTPTLLPASPTPTVTDTETPSPTPTWTATATRPETASPTPTALPTATPAPQPIYLPYASRWRCKPGPRPVDIVLAMDTSSSMAGEKLAAARHAANVFLDYLDLRLGQDRAAVVGFDGSARLVVALTADRGALSAGLGSLAIAPGTRIDLGLEAAIGELFGARARPDVDRAIVLLTDGLPMGGTEAAAEAQGTRARDAGVSTWAIGLGSDVDPAFLARLTAAAERVLIAPGPEDLEAVYRRVASGIVCR